MKSWRQIEMGELSEWFEKKIEEIETSVDEQVSDSQTSGGDGVIINVKIVGFLCIRNGGMNHT